MRTIEIYDTFKPNKLLEVRFEVSEKPDYVRTFRLSYASLYELTERLQWKNINREEDRGSWFSMGEI